MNAAINHASTQDIEATLEELRAKGLVVRLAERRGGSPVYVLPEHVDGRPVDALAPSLTLIALAKSYASRGH